MYRPLLGLVLLLTPALLRADWPGWRGSYHNGFSDEAGIPTTWSDTINVRWKAAIPGAGVSAPIVSRDRVFLTSSTGRSNEHLHLYCFDVADGKPVWHRRFFGSEVSEGQFPPGGMAVPTPTTDGKRVYALFGTGDLVCVGFDGKPVWIRSLAQEYGAFRNRWGMASSPLLLGDLLVVQVDHHGKSYLLGLDAATGRNRWRTLRDAAVNWTSPVPARVGGRTILVAAGTNALKGYAAGTGKELWSVPGLESQCIPTPVVLGDRLWLCGGKDSTSSCFQLRDEGAPRLLWNVKTRGVGIPSPICIEDHFYYAEDNGFVACLEAGTGKPVWRHRLNFKVHASPVAGNDQLYFAGMNGAVVVLRAGPKYEFVAKNDIGEGIVASPALSGGCIFLRGEKHLFCIREK